MSTHPIGLNIEGHKAFYEKAYSHTVGVVNLVLRKVGRSRNQNWYTEDIGTGSLIRFRDKEIVLTAAHVLEHASVGDIQFFPRATGHIDWDSEPFVTGVTSRVAFSSESIITCPADDLACIVLKPGSTRYENVEFLDIEGNTLETAPGSNLLVFGHPTDSAREIARFQTGVGSQSAVMACLPSAYMGAVVERGSRLLEKFDSMDHFLIEFAPASDGRAPFGYSGAGVWGQKPGKKLAENPSVLWNADPVFAGLVTHAYTTSNLLKIVKPNVVMRFLLETFVESAAT